MNPTASPTTARRRAGALAGLLAAVALGVAACGAAGSPIPTLPGLDGLPTGLPDASGMMSQACVDRATLAIIDQLKAPGVDVQAILGANREALLNGLSTFEPADAVTTTWRDAMVTALESNDLQAAATQAAVLASGAVTVTAC